MRKRQPSPTPPSVVPSGQVWLDVDRTAFVEVTSEENGYPIESTLLGVEDRGWHAANSGTQTIRLIFDEPQKLRRIVLVFEDIEVGALKGSSCDGLLSPGILSEKSPAVEFQFTRLSTGDRGLRCGTLRSEGTRIDYCA
jgi:hypothetical protein